MKEAVEFYTAHLAHEAAQDSTSLNDAIGYYLDEVGTDGNKADTLKRYRETLNRFHKAFPERTVASFTGERGQKAA